MVKIAIFASGNGSNAETITRYFRNKKEIEISIILSNKQDAYVLKRAEELEVPAFVFNRGEFNNTHTVLDKLKEYNIDFIVLAGFLLLIPEYLIQAFPNKIINIHPALLPKYGGKGMYGHRVHEAVKNSGDIETGITVHYVNHKYDEGRVIFQKRASVNDMDTPESIAEKVHKLEYQHYPQVIERVIKNSTKNL